MSTPPLIEVIQLKWLLAGTGVRLHVERLLTDPAYAARALEEAESSGNPTLRAAAQRIREQLALQSD